MTLAAVSPVPIPSVAPLPPAMPWWEWALIALLLVAALAYAAALARTRWRGRSHATPTAEDPADAHVPADGRRRLVRGGAWILPALVFLLVVIIQVNIRWTAYREDLLVAQATDTGAATEAFARDLGDAYRVTVDPSWISVIAYPSRGSDIVKITRTDGTFAQCWLWVDTVGAERTATLEIDTCTDVRGT